MVSATAPASSAQSAETLSKAVIRAAELLQLNQAALADVLGVSEATASRLAAGGYKIQPRRKREWEFALLFVRLFRSLDAILGHGEQAHTWLRGENTALGARPVELIRTAEGLVRVLQYLDAHRGRI
jgi:transcriptional regulator with XRE-family HTH domain